ncbi:MAG: DUF4198 domain-containing protein [Fibrobacter sp.]|nr:DUF4198 domain-containing protein [Fibrobacter sp.]
MKYLVLILLVATVLSFSCSESFVNGGYGGSEITNGKVIAFNGKPASGIDVTAYPLTYIPGKSDTLEKKTAVTDRKGNFTIDIDSGLYNLFIIDSLSGSGKLIRDVGPKTDLNTIYLDTLGSISGTLNFDRQWSNHYVVVYSTGTPFLQSILSQGNTSTFVFDGVPTGEYRLSIARLDGIAGCPPGKECNVRPGKNSNNQEIIRVESGKDAFSNILINVDSLDSF